MTVFKARLLELGFQSYKSYLNSQHWANKKEEYAKSGLPTGCAVCGKARTHLHHHNYSNLGNEKVSDFTPLCGVHHDQVHEWLKDNRKMVNATHLAIEAIKNGTALTSGLLRRKRANAPQHEAARRNAYAVLLEEYQSLMQRGKRPPTMSPNYEPSFENRRTLKKHVKWLRKRNGYPKFRKLDAKKLKKAERLKQKRDMAERHAQAKHAAANALKDYRRQRAINTSPITHLKPFLRPLPTTPTKAIPPQPAKKKEKKFFSRKWKYKPKEPANAQAKDTTKANRIQVEAPQASHGSGA